jgi:hypothetical protein
MNLTIEQAEAINTFVDKTHTFFPALSILAIIALIESYLPYKQRYESRLDKIITQCKFGLIIFFCLIALSQGILGGCFIHIPQNWFNETYLGVKNAVPFGLFGRQYIPEQYWILLRIGYFFGSLFAVYRAWEFYKRRVNIKDVDG